MCHKQGSVAGVRQGQEPLREKLKVPIQLHLFDLFQTPRSPMTKKLATKERHVATSSMSTGAQKGQEPLQEKQTMPMQHKIDLFQVPLSPKAKAMAAKQKHVATSSMSKRARACWMQQQHKKLHRLWSYLMAPKILCDGILLSLSELRDNPKWAVAKHRLECLVKRKPSQ